MRNTKKIEFYEDFHCIADQCTFTCCKGWDIAVDSDTYNSWKENDEQTGLLCKEVCGKREQKETQYHINMGHDKSCPFLEDSGLCSIVVKHGENKLPKICKTFPRIENSYDDMTEYSLSCACPVVVDLVNSSDNHPGFLSEEDRSFLHDIKNDYQIREVMISIMKNGSLPLVDRILLIFHMLTSIREDALNADTILNRYQKDGYLHSLKGIWNGIEVNPEDSFLETNELFLDLVSEYQREKHYQDILPDIAVFADKLDTEEALKYRNDFQMAFAPYEKLLEKCFMVKIFSGGICDDIEDRIMSYQLLVTEYIMVKHSAFLKWLMELGKEARKELNYGLVRDYITAFTRIIGNNPDGMREFWEESYDEPVWNLGYLLLLLKV